MKAQVSLLTKVAAIASSLTFQHHGQVSFRTLLRSARFGFSSHTKLRVNLLGFLMNPADFKLINLANTRE